MSIHQTSVYAGTILGAVFAGLIADKLGGADWHAHLGASDSLFVNASTWALLLTGRIVRSADVAEDDVLVTRGAVPTDRYALGVAVDREPRHVADHPTVGRAELIGEHAVGAQRAPLRQDLGRG